MRDCCEDCQDRADAIKAQADYSELQGDAESLIVEMEEFLDTVRWSDKDTFEAVVSLKAGLEAFSNKHISPPLQQRKEAIAA